jgi:hypothetical protein
MKFTFLNCRKRGLFYFCLIYQNTESKDLHALEDNIKMDINETGRERVDWIHLDQDRDKWRVPVNGVINSWVPQNVGNFLTSSEAIRFSRRTPLTALKLRKSATV